LIETFKEPTTSGEGLSTPELVRLFSVLSHDLKSPIFSIDGFSDLLLADYKGKLDEEGEDFLRRIRNGAHQMRRTLEAMSTAVKLLSREPVLEKVDLSELLEEIRLRYTHAVEDGQVQLTLPQNGDVVMADREMLREALCALLSNALQFNDNPPGEQRVSVEIEGGKTICVSDNGIGIDPRYIDQLFEPGLKLDKSRGEGPGYGLFLARKVARIHGGELLITSQPGEGTRACLTIP
jgi:signal transduction histidine kinase